MKVRSFTTKLTQLKTNLPYFLPDRLGQLITSLPDDGIKEILYHLIPNMWKKEMVEQEYNYLEGPIHSMAEFFETRIENLEKSIPPTPQTNSTRQFIFYFVFTTFCLVFAIYIFYFTAIS